MKFIALLLLVACAPAVTAIPSSLPYVRIDPALSGAVISREAAIVIAARRAEDKARLAKANIDAEAKQLATEYERDEANKRAENHTWWADYGPILLLTATLASLGVGFGVGYGAAPRR